MQPHRYFNELDHWRNNAQRPHPIRHSPPGSPPMKPGDEKQDLFAVEGHRGWLEYTEDDSFEKDKDTAKKKLPAVSNAKILELTKMTDQLTERIPKQHQQRPKKKEQHTFASTEYLPSNSYPSPTRPSVSTPSPSRSERRLSWYKHLMKRDKGKGRATTDDEYSSNASSIDPRLHHPSVFGSESSHSSLHRRTSSDVPNRRRFSSDSDVPVILSSPESVHEEPEPIEIQEESSSGEEDEQQSLNSQDQEQELLFDYDALPDEVLGLLREYEKQGKMKIEEQQVKHYNNDDEEDEDAVDVSRLVTTIHDDESSVAWKRIATVRANRSDKAEFVKLVHLTDGNSMRNGYLLDLHVSMLGDNVDDEE
ncbi:hypothetical protein BJV82DRAFT_33437 [Fennellomyces sp. T-0311]|nr:hypothetical protein BJV82DRAFT_33437 [Fennellomyces sp. T-0311]